MVQTLSSPNVFQVPLLKQLLPTLSYILTLRTLVVKYASYDSMYATIGRHSWISKRKQKELETLKEDFEWKVHGNVKKKDGERQESLGNNELECSVAQK